MPNFGIIYYIDGVKNLYRRDVVPTAPLWRGLCAVQILHRRLSGIGAIDFVLLLPESENSELKQLASELGISVTEFDSQNILEKPYGLNQQHWFLEDSSGNDSWYGEAFVKVFEQHPDWKYAVLVPLTNLLIDARDMADSLELYIREGFEACFVEERIPGAEWAIFDSDLVRGLYRSNPEIMSLRGGLYWALRKPLYPFKVGAYHCPRIRPAITANLRLNSLRALNCYGLSAPDNFDSPDFSYEDFLNDSGWEKAFASYSPLQINIEPSSICGASCKSCPNPVLKREKGFLSLQDFSRILEGIEDYDQRLVFSGAGEPLLNKDLPEMLKLASGFNIALHTSLQVPFEEDFPFETLDHIRISIDSISQSSFEQLRKGCSWQNIQNFIEKAYELKKSYDTRFPEIGLDYLRRGCSEKDILPFMKKWKSECDFVFKDNFYRWPLSLKPSKLSWIQISGEAEFCGLVSNTSTVSFEPFKRRLCRNGILTVTVLSDGTVTGCPFDSEGKYSKLGSLKESDLMTIWKSERASVWRQGNISKIFVPDSYCIHCHDWFRYS